MNKSEFAFLSTCRELFKSGPVTFWTLTFKLHHDLDSGFRAWHLLNAEMSRSPYNWSGVRVVEWHPGGHGVHFHLLNAGKIPIREFKRIASLFGFGRIGVELADAGAAEYLAKYLSKSRSETSGLGRRRKWGCYGGHKGTRVRDVKVDSPLAENCRRVRKILWPCLLPHLSSGQLLKLTNFLLTFRKLGPLVVRSSFSLKVYSPTGTGC